jgi:hypothetical protein
MALTRISTHVLLPIWLACHGIGLAKHLTIAACKNNYDGTIQAPDAKGFVDSTKRSEYSSMQNNAIAKYKCGMSAGIIELRKLGSGARVCSPVTDTQKSSRSASQPAKNNNR